MGWFTKNKSKSTHDFEYEIITEIGQYEAMEDTYCCHTDLIPGSIVVGIFDGHGGDKVSKAAKTLFPPTFKEHFNKEESPKVAFHKTYKSMSSSMQEKYIGSTAGTALIDKKTICFAHLGDVRITVITDKNVKALTKDHRLSNVEEALRIKSLGVKTEGEYIKKGFAGIMPTRAFGDLYFKDVGILDIPVTGEYTFIAGDKWILMGTDGLFDFASDEELIRIIGTHSTIKEISKMIRDLVLIDNGGSDNLTFFLMKIKTLQS